MGLVEHMHVAEWSVPLLKLSEKFYTTVAISVGATVSSCLCQQVVLACKMS